MVTEIYPQDVKKFIHLCDERIWKKAIKKKDHMLGSMWETKVGMLPAGVMIYAIKSHVGQVKESFIYVKWVYASLVASKPEVIYEDFFDEIQNVAKRLNINLISISIPKTEEYNCEGLSSYIEKRGYVLREGNSENIDAVLKIT